MLCNIEKGELDAWVSQLYEYGDIKDLRLITANGFFIIETQQISLFTLSIDTRNTHAVVIKLKTRTSFLFIYFFKLLTLILLLLCGLRAYISSDYRENRNYKDRKNKTKIKMHIKDSQMRSFYL